MASFEEIPLTPKSNGMAKILAIGTANPPYATYQTDFPDFYFGATNTQHLTPLNAKFKRICEKSMIRKRHLIVNEEILKENQNMIDYEASSLTTRLALLATEVPKLGKEASEKAIKEWGQPKSKITHVVFGTNSYLDTPGPDHYLVKLLGLEPSVKRFLLREGGCHSGGTLLRLAKDMAENNPGARVLVVCVEVCSIICFGALKETNLLPHALFGDGAGAMIVGADPDEFTEQPIFELVSAGQTILPDTEGAIHIRVREMGKNGDLSPDVPKLIAKNTEDVLLENFKQFGIDDWNSLFWIAHPGGPAILNQIEAAIGLEKSKLGVTRHVLGEFGNMWGATVMFVLDEMRKRSLMEGKTTTGEGLEWGVLIGFGPGITVETIVLRSISLVK